MPSRDAVSRSITRLVANPWFCWSVETSRSCGMARMRASNCGAQVFSSFRFSSESVYWYCAVAAAAANLNILLRLQKERCAGHAGELAAQAVHHLVGRDDLAVRILAILRIFQCDEHAAHIAAAASGAVAAHKGRHRQDGRIIPAPSAQVPLLLAAWQSKLMSCAARVAPPSRPVSCCGKNPLGTMM